jgi:hypothetical protein
MKLVATDRARIDDGRCPVADAGSADAALIVPRD